VKKIGMILAVVLLLSGCGKQAEVQCRVITGVQVEYQRQGEILERVYTRQESIGSVMNYLRMLKPAGPVRPQRDDSCICRITVRYSYGPDKVFVQQGNDCLQQDGGMWKEIDVHQAQLLYPMLLLLPSDV